MMYNAHHYVGYQRCSAEIMSLIGVLATLTTNALILHQLMELQKLIAMHYTGIAAIKRDQKAQLKALSDHEKAQTRVYAHGLTCLPGNKPH